MNRTEAKPGACPVHGAPTHRSTCAECNAAYMRGYLRRRRSEAPGKEMLERAKKRAKHRGVDFALTSELTPIPPICPAVGIPLITSGARTRNSPSLDRISPREGYVPGNVRVISDHANRLKGNLTLPELRLRARRGTRRLRRDYELIADYVDRESLLAEVRIKAKAGGHMGEEWKKVERFLDRLFSRGYPFNAK